MFLCPFSFEGAKRQETWYNSNYYTVTDKQLPSLEICIYLLPGRVVSPLFDLWTPPAWWWRHLHHLRRGWRYLHHLWGWLYNNDLFITTKARSNELTQYTLHYKTMKSTSLSKVEKHMTYFLQWAISFRYSSATTQYKIFLGQYILYILEHQITTHLPSDIHLKSVKLLINLVKYEKQYSPSREAMISATSRPQCHKFSP